MSAHLITPSNQRYYSLLASNSALGNGGAINALESSNLDIEYSLFMNNDAVIGGAINNLGTAGIIQSVFLENTAFAAVSEQQADTTMGGSPNLLIYSMI